MLVSGRRAVNPAESVLSRAGTWSLRPLLRAGAHLPSRALPPARPQRRWQDRRTCERKRGKTLRQRLRNVAHESWDLPTLGHGSGVSSRRRRELSRRPRHQHKEAAPPARRTHHVCTQDHGHDPGVYTRGHSHNPRVYSQGHSHNPRVYTRGHSHNPRVYTWGHSHGPGVYTDITATTPASTPRVTDVTPVSKHRITATTLVSTPMAHRWPRSPRKMCEITQGTLPPNGWAGEKESKNE